MAASASRRAGMPDAGSRTTREFAVRLVAEDGRIVAQNGGQPVRLFTSGRLKNDSRNSAGLWSAMYSTISRACPRGEAQRVGPRAGWGMDLEPPVEAQAAAGGRLGPLPTLAQQPTTTHRKRPPASTRSGRSKQPHRAGSRHTVGKSGSAKSRIACRSLPYHDWAFGSWDSSWQYSTEAGNNTPSISEPARHRQRKSIALLACEPMTRQRNWRFGPIIVYTWGRDHS